jgi:trehalose 6-phosphate synthase
MNRRIVTVSNRVPITTGGNVQAGGLTVSLEDLMKKYGGIWFGWNGQITDQPSIQPDIEEQGLLSYATVSLSHEQHQRYYADFSNGVLWPLFHSMPTSMYVYQQSAAEYQAVNEYFAKLLQPMLQPKDIIWIHDYHLIALPRILRSYGIKMPIGFFLHVPFPGPDILMTIPNAAQFVLDLLTSNLIGFQTLNDKNNFIQSALRLTQAQQEDADILIINGHTIRLGVFSVEIDSKRFATTARKAWHSSVTQRLHHSLDGQKLILGVDRLDPTKGILQRLAGYHRFLETRPNARRKVTFLQIAALCRLNVPAYQELRHNIERKAGALNGDFSEVDWVPLRVVERVSVRSAVAGYMREARVGLITPLRDGMNLVAKEYIAAQNPDNPGVLVLSKFAGAADQLKSALLVNPNDPDDIADALERALDMPLAERQTRWQECWQAIEKQSGVKWGQSFLKVLREI